jgi:hypothetical protein
LGDTLSILLKYRAWQEMILLYLFGKLTSLFERWL